MNEEQKKLWEEFKREMSNPQQQHWWGTINAADAELTRLRARFTAPIVCLCGSTRFKQSWIAENARLTGEGNIVLAVGLWGHHERVFPDADTKKRLDELHLRKIDLCNWVWVLDVGGYIGESTRNKITYAEAHGKQVRYLSKEFPNYVEPVDPLAAANEAREEAESALCRAREAFEDCAKEAIFRDSYWRQSEKTMHELGDTIRQKGSAALSSSSPCPHAEAEKRLNEILSMTESCINSMVIKASDANDYARNIQRGLREELEKVAELRRRSDAG